MPQSEMDELVKALAPLVSAFVVKAMEPLKAECKRLSDELVAVKAAAADRPVVVAPDEAAVGSMVDAAVAKAVSAIEIPQGPDMAMVALMVGEKVEAAVAELPPAEPGESGKSVTVEELLPVVEEVVQRAVAAIEVPGPDMDFVGLAIGEKVAAAMAQLPVPQDGKSITVEDVAPMIAAEVAKAVAEIPVPKDGVGLAGALIDREGQLVVTMTDGSSKALGVVVGKDVDIDAVGEMVRAEVAKIPHPKDGVDGLGFDDLDVVDVDGDCVLRFSRGDLVKDFVLPVTTYRGVWTEKSYRKGSGVTWAGSYWIAERDTKGKPDTQDSGWRLAVKKGRNGTDGAPGKPGPQGPKGEPGERGFPGRNA